MYRNACQRGLLTIFFGGGSKPLSIWDTFVRDGYVTRFLDQEIKSMVLEIGGSNISTTYMVCPKGNMVLGIVMPFLVMVVKNLKKYFSFEVTVLDDTNTRRRFRVSNFQSNTQILPLCTVMPIALSDGWNQIQFNLAEFTRRAYKKAFVEVQKVKINANIRIRRIYFAERLLSEEQLPAEYKLFMPISSKRGKSGKENVKPSTSVAIVETGEPEKKAYDGVPPGSKTSIHTIMKLEEVNVDEQIVKEQAGVARSTQVESGGEALKEEEKQEETKTEEVIADAVAGDAAPETAEKKVNEDGPVEEFKPVEDTGPTETVDTNEEQDEKTEQPLTEEVKPAGEQAQ